MAAQLQHAASEPLHDPTAQAGFVTPPMLFTRVCIPAKNYLSNLLLLILAQPATISILPKGSGLHIPPLVSAHLHNDQLRTADAGMQRSGRSGPTEWSDINRSKLMQLMCPRPRWLLWFCVDMGGLVYMRGEPGGQWGQGERQALGV